jgi:hypothetical protein
MNKLTKEEFQEWQSLRETQLVLQYLSDVRVSLKDGWSDAFASGAYLDLNEKEKAMESGKCQILEDVVDLEFEDIDNFYEEDYESSVGQSNNQT